MATLDHEKHITGDASPTAQPQYSEPDGGQVHGVFGLGAEHVQRESVKEILDILGVGDDRLVSHADEFWRSAATALDLPAPDGDAITTARFVIEHLGSWDEDYLSDDGKSLSLAAYNEVLSLLNALTGGRRPNQHLPRFHPPRLTRPDGVGATSPRRRRADQGDGLASETRRWEKGLRRSRGPREAGFAGP